MRQSFSSSASKVCNLRWSHFQKIWTLRTTSVFISFYLGNYMTGLVPFVVLILVSNERGFAQQQRFLL